MARPDPALSLLGLAARANALVWGTERVRDAVRGGEVLFVIVAADVSDNSLDKLVPLLEKRGVPHVVRFDRAQLGDAVGKAPLSAVGLTDASFAARLKDLTRETTL